VRDSEGLPRIRVPASSIIDLTLELEIGEAYDT
jgi:hypothetical protein